MRLNLLPALLTRRTYTELSLGGACELLQGFSSHCDQTRSMSEHHTAPQSQLECTHATLATASLNPRPACPDSSRLGSRAQARMRARFAPSSTLRLAPAKAPRRRSGGRSLRVARPESQRHCWSLRLTTRRRKPQHTLTMHAQCGVLFNDSERQLSQSAYIMTSFMCVLQQQC